MRRVCVLTSVHPAFDVRIFHKECKSLARAGYEVTLIAPHENDEVIDGVRIKAVPRPRGRLARMTRTVWEVYRQAVRLNADVYHFHDPELIPVGLFLRAKGKKVIYDVHEDYYKQTLSKHYIPKMARKVIGLFIKIMEYMSAKIFDGIVTATDDILKNFLYHKRAVSVKNYPLISVFSETKETRKNDGSVFTLIYVGGLSEIRGISQMIQALDLLDGKPVRLTLCGGFDPAEYEAEIKKIKGFKKVDLVGWIEPHFIPDMLLKSDVGIVCFHPVANHVAALPNKLFEYMASGLPVIASNFPLWKEIIEGNKCGICVNPLKPEEIAQAIKWFIEHPQEAEAMAHGGREAVEKHYNWGNEERKLLQLYADLVGPGCVA